MIDLLKAHLLELELCYIQFWGGLKTSDKVCICLTLPLVDL